MSSYCSLTSWLLLLLGSVPTTTAWMSMMSDSSSSSSSSSSNGSIQKVTVLGGTGFVGSRVCQQLVETGGVSVTSVSKTGQIPAWASNQEWTSQVDWKAADLLNQDQCNSLLASTTDVADAMISCVGVVGTDPKELLQGNGVTNVNAFEATSGNLQRAVVVSVASEVAACQDNWLPEFFASYFQGKKDAEVAALKAVGGDKSKLVVVSPTFIYGGDKFELLPPRVTTEYGSFIEELLSNGIISKLADICPGLIKVALRPPNSVDAVAAACVAGALGQISAGASTTLEGAVEINQATNQPPATGLTDAIDFAKEKTIEFYDWAKVEAPKALDAAKLQIEKIQAQSK